MMKINVYSEKSGNFASDSKMKPMIIIESKKKTLESLKAQYPDAMIIDVTSHAQDEFVKFSPFYPNGGIPVPFTDDIAVSVEGIWQGLKVFEDADVDTSFFSKRDMKNLKRTVRKYGPCLGHRKGVHGEELLGYIEAKTNFRSWLQQYVSFRKTSPWYCSITILTQM